MALSEKASEFLDQQFLMRWADYTMDDIRKDFDRRGIFPYGNPGPFPGYLSLNEKRKQKKKWHSTGMGIQQMYARVWRSANGDQAKVTFFFKRYLNLMDMGVGKGRKITDVDERRQDAKYNKPLAKWGVPSDMIGGVTKRKGEQSRKSRPALLMEIRHQLTKMQYIISENIDELVEAAAVLDETGMFTNKNGLQVHYGQSK